jgi:hypothetical protein
MLNRFFPGKIQFNFDAIDGFTHEKLIDLGIVCLAFTELYAFFDSSDPQTLPCHRN